MIFTTPRIDTPSSDVRRNLFRPWMIAAALVVVIPVVTILNGSHGKNPSGSSSTTVAIPSLPGPTRIVAGVPVGYPHTRDGALSAEVNYERAWFKAVALPADQRVVVLNAFVAEQSREGMGQLAIAANAVLIDEVGGRLVSSQVPVSARVLIYDEKTAVVASWSVQVTSGDKLEFAREDWGLVTASLVWEDNDWKLVSFSSTPNPPAPVPSTSSTAVKSSDAYDLLSGMSEFYHAPIPR